MTGAGAIQCPHCGTFMDERSRFCPGCGTPRTAVREQLECEAATSGTPYSQLLERERTSGNAGVAPGSTGWSAQAIPAAPAPKTRSRLWLVLGIIGGVLLLLCVGCAVVFTILINRFNVNLGDSTEGEAVQAQLRLASTGRHAERWELLHPDQQRVVPVELFATCAEYDGAGSVDILASFGNDDSFIPRAGNIDTRVVIFTFSDGGSTETEFVEMVRLNDAWRWTMTEEQIVDYEAGRCP